MPKIQDVAKKMQISPTNLTQDDIELAVLASKSGAIPVDGTCIHCGGFGIRKATKEDLPFMVLDEYQRRRFDAGDPFTVVCEHCKDQRRAEFVLKWQEKSRFTESERAIRMEHIITGPQTPGTNELKKACQEMLEGTAYFLTVQGSSGNAKSVALMAVANEFLRRGDSALYITLTDALDWIQDPFNKEGTLNDNDTALSRYKQLENAFLLVLDEMQDAKESDWTMKILANLVNRRQRQSIDGNCFTILCTNKPVDQLPPQILSRLKDGRNRTHGKPIIINNDKDRRADMRRKQTK